MSRDGTVDDVSALLYLVPFAASGLYGLFLWLRGGISLYLPTQVYLTVTRDPILFAVASLSVMGGVVLEVRSTPEAERGAKLSSLSNTLQSIAVASIVLTFIAAVYANGLDVAGAATDFVVGRYGLVFPVILVLLSYLVTAKFNLDSLRSPKVLGVVALLLVPVAIYEVGRRQVAVGLALSLALLIVGLAPYVYSRPKSKPEAEKQ